MGWGSFLVGLGSRLSSQPSRLGCSPRPAGCVRSGGRSARSGADSVWPLRRLGRLGRLTGVVSGVVQVGRWGDDPNQYVADEEDDFSTVRCVC